MPSSQSRPAPDRCTGRTYRPNRPEGRHWGDRRNRPDRPILVDDVPVRQTADLKDGDTISIDIPARTLTLELSEEEIARRLADWQPAPRDGVTGYLARYVKLVSGAEKGAVLQ